MHSLNDIILANLSFRENEYVISKSLINFCLKREEKLYIPFVFIEDKERYPIRIFNL